jgi:RNA polymerase sigma factor (sigma-70 family)
LRRDRIKFDRSMLEAVKRHLRTAGDHRRPTAESVTAWRQFYSQCDPLIRRFVRIYVNTNSDMEDCSQEVWVRLIKHLKTFDYDPSRGAFSSWLYRVVRSVTASYFRHEFRVNDGDKRSAMSMVPADTRSDPAQMMEALDSQKRVEAMLLTIRRNVSRPNYELLYMRWVQQRSVEDVANALDLSNKQVWYREHRARKKLRGVLGNPDL